MRPVIWSRKAQADLREAVVYISADNPFAARRVADRIKQAVSGLADRPTGRRSRVADVFEKPVRGTSYILAYDVRVGGDGRETIYILRVIHGARDWPDGEWPE